MMAGFYVAWVNESAGELQGARFDGLGAAIGTVGTISTDGHGTGGNISSPELGLTADGRILASWGEW